ncbi:MAG: lysophospholipid acyltransferase family protein [Bacteriovoracaceae bacterium]|nr:lysophospholipid acyltransferase family protein [Bacteriovoracaceae bacterium]
MILYIEKMVKRFLYFLVRLFDLTYRYRFHNSEVLENAAGLSEKGNYLLAIWHQNLFQGILAQSTRKYVVIVSRSKDAEPVAYTCQKFGHSVARGSSRSKTGVDKGGRIAMEEMVDLLKSGLPGAVTVDGPKGPAKKVKPGIIVMAKKAGIPIIPYAPLARNYWQFNSWDNFRLPKPFSIIDIYYGEPLTVTDLPLEEALVELEIGLNQEFPQLA